MTLRRMQIGLGILTACTCSLVICGVPGCRRTTGVPNGGRIPSHKTPNPSSEIAKLRRAIVLNPRDHFAHEQLSVLLSGTGKQAEAFQEIKAAIRLAPAQPWYRYRLGEMEESEGDNIRALADYRFAISLMERTGADSASAPVLYIAAGRTLDRLGRDREAAAAYRKALRSLEKPEVVANCAEADREAMIRAIRKRLER